MGMTSSYRRFDVSREYEYVERLKKELNESNARIIYTQAESYCSLCEKPHHLSPMLTCAYKCEIWKIKNKALTLMKSGKVKDRVV